MAEATSISQVVFKFSSRGLAGEINLKPEAWRILAQINGVHSVFQIAQGIGMDEATAIRVVDALYKAGLLEVAAGSLTPPRPTVNGLFFEQISSELTWSMGPVAEIILFEEINALGETRERFPRDRIAELVEHVSKAITDEGERMRFQQIMLEAIRKL